MKIVDSICARRVSRCVNTSLIVLIDDDGGDVEDVCVLHKLLLLLV